MTLGKIIGMAAAIVALDAVWLTSTMKTSTAMFSRLQGQPLTIRWIPAILVYVLIVGAIWFFASGPGLTVQEAAGRGGALGLAMYGVYDLTNYATLAKYPLSFALTDMAWGTFLCASVAAVGALV
jgi:uncharacterized membrane protein